MHGARTIIRRLSKISFDIISQIKHESETRFDSILKNVKLVTVEGGRCVAEMKVQKEHTNPWNTLHEGFSFSLVDTISHYAIATHPNNYMQPSITVNVHLTFLDKAMTGDEIVIDAETVKAGKKLCYLKSNIRNKNTGKVLIEGNHLVSYIDSAKSLIEN